jgi:nucleoside-diphosphate-sugar epimerase
VTRVLVSGAGGFVGVPLLRQLVGADREVHALSTHAQPEAPAGVSWHVIDLFDQAAVEALMDGLMPEQLVHLAWYTEHGRYWNAPENVVWVERSLQLLRAFVQCGGRRAVMLGTCAEYDWSTIGGPLLETGSPLAPATLYGVAKDALRRVADAYAEQQGVELAWARLFFLYGPREAPERLVASVIRSLSRGQPVATGRGAHVRDYMHVEDVARALVALLDSPVVGPVNIASGVGVSVEEVVEPIVEAIGRRELVRWGGLPERPGEPSLLLADVTRMREEVGYRPRWALADGILATVRWWQEHERRIIRAAAHRTAAPRCSPPPAWPAPRR